MICWTCSRSLESRTGEHISTAVFEEDIVVVS
jgi:hypothetical protein